MRLLTDYPFPLPSHVFKTSLVTTRGTVPVGMGITHPCNARFRWQALALHGRGDAIVNDVAKRWSRLISISENGTLPESWELAEGSMGSYGKDMGVRCQGNLTVPEMLYRLVLGLEPLTPGWKTLRVNPQLGELGWVSGSVLTPAGFIRLHASRLPGGKVRCRLEYLRDMTPVLGDHVVLGTTASQSGVNTLDDRDPKE